MDDVIYEGSGSTPSGGGEGIIGVEIFRDGEWIAEVYAPNQTYTDIEPGDVDEYEIRVVYDGLEEDWTYYAMSCPQVAIVGEAVCQAPDNLVGQNDTSDDSVIINWTYGDQPSGSTLFYDFENGTMGDLTTIDADGDGWCWDMISQFAGTGHNGSSDGVYSQSYDNNYGVLYPDNYLVTPQVTLGGTFSFWACAQDASYAAEHFGVAISTSGNTNAADFTTIQEWTMTAKAGAPTNVTRDGGRTQGTWYQYSVDLSAYFGQTGYIAIRHFNCSDWFYLDVDDIQLGAAKRSFGDPISFNVYRDGEVIANVPFTGDYQYSYIDYPGIGNYVYQVTAVYDGCESDFAMTPDLSMNYYQVYVDAVGEIDNAKLYPNPTNGDVTIEAAGMTHISVVSVLGQVIYDADIQGDNTQLHLGQYKAGVYTVRINTESGVSVKRVTVVK